MIRIQGACHCGNISVQATFSKELSSFFPRICDCDFCTKHGASYVSDPKGQLIFQVKDESQMGQYKQGSAAADFILCKICGVLAGVNYRSSEGSYGAVNFQCLNGKELFGKAISVSPKSLKAEEKTERWKQVWFPHMKIISSS